MASNSWRSSCLRLPITRITSIGHHAQLNKVSDDVHVTFILTLYVGCKLWLLVNFSPVPLYTMAVPELGQSSAEE